MQLNTKSQPVSTLSFKVYYSEGEKKYEKAWPVSTLSFKVYYSITLSKPLKISSLTTGAVTQKLYQGQ